jgi:gas vesicle protein
VDYVEVGTLFGTVVILVVAVLTLRSAQRSVQLAETRYDYLLEEKERMEFMREEHKSLQEELERERQECQSLQEALKQEGQERLQAQLRAERAEQEALREATQQLRERMDNYLEELEENGRPAIRRVK